VCRPAESRPLKIQTDPLPGIAIGCDEGLRDGSEFCGEQPQKCAGLMERRMLPLQHRLPELRDLPLGLICERDEPRR
jgi:hypothetical protein